ncbi:DUF3306 domain-containing protein [Halodurantibacterium flavum]|uniref:DUF3306 domain-containing protein n=1 Tax=Halodurantibacterium flavum TaxID=1382802 RepID=A0ABW4S6F2_9RHOB
MATEPFLTRWSRTKRAEAASETGEPPPDDPDGHPAPTPSAEEDEAAHPEATPEDPELNLPELPDIETLGPDSDYRVFMRAGVPAALRTAALRKAWVARDAIAAHRPMVEYAWDTNAPGYGALRPGDDVAATIATLIRRYAAQRAHWLTDDKEVPSDPDRMEEEDPEAGVA